MTQAATTVCTSVGCQQNAKDSRASYVRKLFGGLNSRLDSEDAASATSVYERPMFGFVLGVTNGDGE